VVNAYIIVSLYTTLGIMQENEVEMKKAATSIKINPEIWKEAKIAAINFNTTVSDLVENAIKDYIRKHKK
jgi:hypothetical protein